LYHLAFQATNTVYGAGYDLAIRSTILPVYQNEASAMGTTSTNKARKAKIRTESEP
jgi:hypothetical protein